MADNSSAKPPREPSPTALNKPVAALAIVPHNKSLTVTARKAYNVMLHLAQREGDTGDAGFSAPLNAILRGFGADNKIAGDAKRYIEQMMSTKIEWRALTKGEQWLLPADGAAPAADDAGDELRMFNMLSEVRLYKKNGENWVTWFYPPTIKEQMLGPHRWARLELEVIARLSTYTAVALYEICARYRDNPAGMTARHHWSWWVPVLRGSDAGKQREWRKFKNEFVTPAIREINQVADLEIELVEFKQGRAVADVQFAVRRRDASGPPPEPPDVSQLLRGAALGLREQELEALQERHGETALGAGLDALERALQGAKPVANRLAYLKGVLARALPAGAPAPEGRAAAEDLPARRQAQLRLEFEALPADEQQQWIAALKAELLTDGGTAPTLLRRLDAGQWQSPLVLARLLRFYASRVHGVQGEP